MSSTMQLDEDFDIVFDENGSMVLDDGRESLEQRLRLDLSTNSNWYLSSELGLPYLTEEDDGILQSKTFESDLKTALALKMQEYEEVNRIISIETERGLDRNFLFKVSLETVYGTLNLEVGN